MHGEALVEVNLGSTWSPVEMPVDGLATGWNPVKQ